MDSVDVNIPDDIDNLVWRINLKRNNLIELARYLTMKKYSLKLNDDVALILNEGTENGQGDSSSLEKGLMLNVRNNSVCGEGVGFGVPALEYPDKIIFSTSAKIHKDDNKFVKSFSMDAYHRVVWMHKFLINDKFYSIISDKFKQRYQQDKKYQKLLQFLMKFMILLGLRLLTQRIPSRGSVDISYKTSGYNLIIDVDASNILDKKYAKLLIFNEQSSDFDLYKDELVELRKGDIGVWEEVYYQKSCLTNESINITFCLKKLDAIKLFRGREVLQPRLDWAGFCYVIPSKIRNLHYIINLK